MKTLNGEMPSRDLKNSLTFSVAVSVTSNILSPLGRSGLLIVSGCFSVMSLEAPF
jgi:hypothetical protein